MTVPTQAFPDQINTTGLVVPNATAATGLSNSSTTVSTSAAAAPTGGQVLTATSSTAATWQTPAATYTGPTTRNVVTGSRAANTTYQNTTGFAMWVTITANFTGSSAVAYVDSFSPPTTAVVVTSNSNAAPDTIPVTFIVPDGFYYKFTNSFSHWTEWY